MILISSYVSSQVTSKMTSKIGGGYPASVKKTWFDCKCKQAKIRLDSRPFKNSFFYGITIDVLMKK